MELPNINTCFSDLEIRLYKLQNDFNPLSIKGAEYLISEILENGLFKYDNEDIQEQLIYYIEEIEIHLQNLPKAISSTAFQDKIIDTKEGPFSFETIPADTQRNLALDGCIKELDYYKSELKKLLDRVEEKIHALGSSRFSNANLQIQLDFNNEEIGALFNALLEKGLIKKMKSNGSELTKKELASFISKNFINKTGRLPSAQAIQNYLNRNNPGAENSVNDQLKKIVEFLSR